MAEKKPRNVPIRVANPSGGRYGRATSMKLILLLATGRTQARQTAPSNGGVTFDV